MDTPTRAAYIYASALGRALGLLRVIRTRTTDEDIMSDIDQFISEEEAILDTFAKEKNIELN